MNKALENLIEGIKSVPTSFEIDNEEEIRVIIGNDIYPPKSKISNIKCPKIPIYKGFKDVAFLTNTKNLNLVSIVGILLGSIDFAIDLLKAIIDNNCVTMEQFALYLAYKRIILINNDGNESALESFFDIHKNHKVLFVGEKSEDPDYIKKIKNDLWLYHCSGITYSSHGVECYKSYFEHDFEGFKEKPDFNKHNNNLHIRDFKI